MNNFGLVKSLPDNRDWSYAAVMGSVPLPKAFAWPRTPLRDQGQHGTCVGFGSANLKDIQEMADSEMVTSPLYVYREAKAIDGLPEGTQGTTLKAALSVLKNKGVCSEADYPYSLIDLPPVEPSVSLETIARGKIAGYAQCVTVEDIKQAIYQSGPVLVGIGVTAAFRNLGVGEHHIKTLFGDVLLGGHCVVFDAFDDTTGEFRVKNSWANWGDDGYAYMSYNCVTERAEIGFSYFWEAWSTVDVKTGFVGERIKVTIGNKVAIVNGKEELLPVAPRIIDDRTMMPLRWVFEKAGYTVEWNNDTRTATCTK